MILRKPKRHWSNHRVAAATGNKVTIALSIPIPQHPTPAMLPSPQPSPRPTLAATCCACRPCPLASSSCSLLLPHNNTSLVAPLSQLPCLLPTPHSHRTPDAQTASSLCGLLTTPHQPMSSPCCSLFPCVLRPCPHCFHALVPSCQPLHLPLSLALPVSLALHPSACLSPCVFCCSCYCCWPWHWCYNFVAAVSGSAGDSHV